MNTHLEIEYKQLLPESIYNKIKVDHFSNCSAIKQTNYYFTDTQGILSQKRYSLRVREIKDTYEFTLKIPQGFSKLEINENIDKDQFTKIQHNIEFPSIILDKLKEINVSICHLQPLTSLTTIRLEKEYRHGVLSIDESFYQGIIDYEIEYEAENEEDGKEIFESFLNQYHLVYETNCLGKFTRALQALTKKAE